jgi:uncharacterized protein YkwD
VEARRAFEQLNRIRKEPVAHCQRLKFSPIQVLPRPALVWNDTLARAAERKARDMARRNYFAHVDPEGYGMNHHIVQAGYDLDPGWLTDPRANNFESIQAGCDNGAEAIECLIVDYGVPSKGHRTHLLGVGEWNASLVDIGIGFVRYDGPSEYTTYTCVLIAKHR